MDVLRRVVFDTNNKRVLLTTEEGAELTFDLDLIPTMDDLGFQESRTIKVFLPSGQMVTWEVDGTTNVSQI